MTTSYDDDDDRRKKRKKRVERNNDGEERGEEGRRRLEAQIASLCVWIMSRGGSISMRVRFDKWFY